MPQELSVGSLGVDIAPYLQGLEQATAADRKLNELVLAGAQQQQQAFAQVATRLAEVATGSRAAAVAQQQYASDIAGLVKEIRDQAAAQRDAQRAGAAAAAERRKASQEARDAARAEKQAAKEAAAAAKEVAAAERLRAKEAAAANAETGKSGGVLGKLGGFLGSLQGQVVAAFSVAAIKEFFSEVSKNAIATDATISRLTFANGGDKGAAGRDLAFIRFEAKALGLELNSTGQSYGSFTAAAAAANFPLAEARRLFLAAAGASATLKLSQDDTNGVLLALNQILSKGTVQAEELRGQIGERLPGAFAIAARAMNVTEQQLNKLLQTGQVKSADFLPKFATELQKTFGDGTAVAFDAAIANQNRFENEYNAFLLRFQGATGAATAKAAEYFRRFNEGLDLKSVAGRTRLGEQAAQPGIQNYEAVLAGLVKQTEAEAKKSGEDVTIRVGYLLAQQSNQIEAQKQVAIKALEFFDTSTKQGALNEGNFQGGARAFREAEVQARARVALLDGEIGKLGEVAAARKKADMPTNLEGLVKRQEDLIKSLKARQQAATQENQGGGQDFLLGRGGLKEQIDAAQKELDRLLGKVDKTAKTAADRLAAALRALESARVELATKAAQAAIKESDDVTERAQLRFEEAIRQADLVEKRLKQLEANVRKAGGRGSRADGIIDGVQAEQLTLLRAAAQEQLTKELERINRDRQALLLNLQKDSDQKELDQLEAAFNEQVRLHEREADVLLALEAKYQRDRDALLRAQATRQAERARQSGTNQADATAQVFGAGTGQSVFEAQRAARQQQLDAEREFAEKRLEILKGSKDQDAQVEREALAAQLLRIRNQQKDLNAEQAKAKFSIYKLILGENDSPELRAALDEVASTVASAFASITASQQQAAQQQAADATTRISELTGQLAAEIELHKNGSASNIQTIQNEIKEQKAARREALEDQRAAAKQQVIIDALTQASSITTAAANVFAAFSAIPFVGPILGAVAAGGLIAAFLASKAQAYSAANDIGKSFFVGGYTGDGNERDVSTARGQRGYEYHKREFIMDHELTDKYRRALFEPLHEGKPVDWTHPALQALLPNYELPNQLRAEKQEAARVRHEHSFAPMQAKFDALHAELVEIKATNAQMASQRTVIPTPAGHRLVDPSTGSSHDFTIVP